MHMQSQNSLDLESPLLFIIVFEVLAAIVEMLWRDTVTEHLSTNKDEFKICMARF